MTLRTSCCCDGVSGGEDWFCCNPRLKTQFVTIFDKWMDSAVPVSPTDLIVLRINRPLTRTRGKQLMFRAIGGTEGLCGTCCTAGCAPGQKLYVSPCAVCGERSRTCDAKNNCISGIDFAPSSWRQAVCNEAGPCCDTCGGTTLTSNTPLSATSEVTNLFLENISGKRLFKKPLNRILQNPPSFLGKANPISLQELAKLSTLTNLAKQQNLLINSQGELTQNTTLNDGLNSPSLNDPNIQFINEIADSNEEFKYKVTELYPDCLKCLQEKGYDIDCIRRSNYLEKCKNSKSQIKDFCDDCSKECAAFCNAYFGDTWKQKNNISKLFAHDLFTENYEYVRGATLLDPKLYLGVNVATDRVREYIDPLRESLNNSGTDYDQNTYLPSDTNTKPYFIKPSYVEPSNNTEFENVMSPDSMGWNGRNNAPVITPEFLSCDICNSGGGSPGADPLYLIYRFSGCHIKWYPPEYIFNYNTRVNQGQGYINTENGFLNCDYYLRSPLGETDKTGYDVNLEPSCYTNAYDGAYGTCRSPIFTAASTCQCKDRNLFPCQCYRYPHVSGGIFDTVRKRFNVSERPYVGGYVPYQDPFSPRMRVSESGCMSCYNSASTSDASGQCTPYFEFRRSSVASYPSASGKGKGPPALGAWCNSNKNDPNALPYDNPRYTVDCFNRGISPYLSRISKTLYPAAREIFHYGSTAKAQQEVLSVFYEGGYISSIGEKWTSISFRKKYNNKSNLFHKMVGLVSMEYHFECWAYHSKALFSPQPPICMNHKNAITSPYERPYGGIISATNFTYDPREAFRYFAMRHYPRRVMYGSAAIPVFHSDLYAMELIRERTGGRPFNAADFLEKFYLYFYNMLKNPGDTMYNEPAVGIEEIQMYNEVTYWIKEMIYQNILSVKDHAEDIAEELKQILEGIVSTFDPITKEWSYTFPDSINSAAVGEQAGFIDLIQWIYTKVLLISPTPQIPAYNPKNPDMDLVTYWNTYLKQYVNAKFIKNNLINSDQANLPSYTTTQPIFAGPRRVKLWPSPQSSGLTAWGCENSYYCDNLERRRTPASALNVKTSVSIDNSNNRVEVPFEFVKLFGGQEVYFAITNRGKIRAFGKAPPENSDNLGPQDPIFFPEIISEVVSHGVNSNEVGYYFNGTFNGAGVDAVPTHISVASEGPSASFPDDPDVAEPLDGIVEKVSNKGKFAVALVSYNDGVVYGPNYFECATSSNLAGDNYNNGNTRVFTRYTIERGLGDCNINLTGTNGTSAFSQNEKWKKFSNSGWQSPSICLNGTVVSGSYEACLSPYSTNCLSETDVGQEMYTLKAWGEADAVDYGIFYNPSNQQGAWAPPTCLNRSLSTRRYLMNKFFIWHDVACGTKHTIALTSDGALFATPDSDNEFNQSSYGFPTRDGKRHYMAALGNSMGIEDISNQSIKYFYHYPKPDYFNDAEWQQLVLRNANESLDPEDYTQKRFCNQRRGVVLNNNNISNTSLTPCDIRCYLYTIGNNNDRLYGGGLFNPDDLYGGCVGPPGYNCIEEISADAPVWTDVAAGHYHSMALSSDNNLKIWGSYVKVGRDGEVIQGGNTFESQNPVPVFLPIGEIFPDQWSLSGATLGCSWDRNWKDCAECDPEDSTCLATCYDKSHYTIYTEASKTIFASKEIIFIDGGPDYSILARKAKSTESPLLNGRDGYKLVVWGNSEMVEAVTGISYGMQITAQGSKYYNYIEKITAGPNAIGVLYRNLGGNAAKLDIFERPNTNTGVVNYNEESIYGDIAFTNGTAAALTSSGIKANRWKEESFDSNTHKYLQFKNFNSLPIYFQSQAFFSAVPGTWDFSKWIFGGSCIKIGSDVPDTIVNQIDTCSSYYVKDKKYGGLLSYSGHPQYYWMRGTFRRSSPAVPTWSYEPGPSLGCGLLKDRLGRDGLKPFEESGSGVQDDGNPNTPIANANRALNNIYGSCFGGDVCWVGDGSFSPYPFYRNNPEGGGNGTSGKSCKCRDLKCGCPPSCKMPTRYTCAGGGWTTPLCFGTVTARNGFAANKDYFIQSTKSFGTLSAKTETSGRCCGVTNTNITAFVYAKRDFYYGYNEEKGIFEVKNSPIQYRATTNGGRPYDPTAPVSSTKETNFRLAVSTPSDTINNYNFLINTLLTYPPVYVGGRALLPLEQDVQDTLGARGKVCDPCKPCGPYENCIDATTVCSASVRTLIGPGGWIHSRSTNTSYAQSAETSDGLVDATTVVYVIETLPPDLLPTSIDSFGPLLKVVPYNGRVPQSFWGCTYWKDTIPSTEGPTCGCFRHYPETGVCPNGEQECYGCVWSPKLGTFGGITVDSGLFSIAGSTSIDVLDAYFNGNNLLNEVIQDVEDNSDPDDSQTTTIQNIQKLFRIYEMIPLQNVVCGDGSTAFAIPFGSILGTNVVGQIEAECIKLGKINTVAVVNGGQNYKVGDVVEVYDVNGDYRGESGLLRVTQTIVSTGSITNVEIINTGNLYSAGTKEVSAYSSNTIGVGALVSITITPTGTNVIRANCMGISCLDPDNPDGI